MYCNCIRSLRNKFLHISSGPVAAKIGLHQICFGLCRLIYKPTLLPPNSKHVPVFVWCFVLVTSLYRTFNAETENRLLKMFGVVKHVQLCVGQREETNLVSLHSHSLAPVDIRHISGTTTPTNSRCWTIQTSKEQPQRMAFVLSTDLDFTSIPRT